MTEIPDNSPIATNNQVNVHNPMGKNYTTYNPTNVSWTISSSASCSACRFFDPIPHTDSGTCHRFPKEEVVERSYWCGEFSITRIETK